MKLYNFTPIWQGLGSGATIYHLPFSSEEDAIRTALAFKESWHCSAVEISCSVSQV